MTQARPQGGAALSTSPKRALKVLVVDDHWLFRHALVRLLNDQDFVHVVGEAGDGDAAIEAARTHHPDVVLMDLVMPERDGVAATREIVREFPDIQVVGMTVGDAPGAQNAIVEAGAIACLAKHHFPDSLLHFLERLAEEA